MIMTGALKISDRYLPISGYITFISASCVPLFQPYYLEIIFFGHSSIKKHKNKQKRKKGKKEKKKVRRLTPPHRAFVVGPHRGGSKLNRKGGKKRKRKGWGVEYPVNSRSSSYTWIY